jgi:hypothetical protein
VRRLCAFDQPSTMFVQAPASASSTRPLEVNDLLTMDSSNANHAGELSPNIDLKELCGLDDGIPTDSKDEALPKLVCNSSRDFIALEPITTSRSSLVMPTQHPPLVNYRYAD